MYNDFRHYWDELHSAMHQVPLNMLVRVTKVLLHCQQQGGTIFLCGNGGSAATASHFACDLAKGTRGPDQPLFRVLSLNESVPLMTAWANDVAYEHIFARQLEALARPTDVVMLISASGNSPNILAAAAAAREAGAFVIGLTGENGGQLIHWADLVVHVPTNSIEQVEDAHLAITHSICVTLRKRLNAKSEFYE